LQKNDSEVIIVSFLCQWPSTKASWWYGPYGY